MPITTRTVGRKRRATEPCVRFAKRARFIWRAISICRPSCSTASKAAPPEARLSAAEVNIGRSEVGDSGVMVFVVIPLVKGGEVRTGVLQAAEAVGEVRTVFQRLELGFRIGVIVGDVRS